MPSRHQSTKQETVESTVCQIRSGIFTRDDIKGDDTSQLKLMKTNEALNNVYY